MLEKLEKIHPDIIRDFRRNKKSSALPEDIQNYIRQIDRVMELYNAENNILRAAKRLAAEFPDLSLTTCRDRVYDAINYFHINNTVKEEGWCNFYAEYFEHLSHLAEKEKNITEARRCATMAAEYRIRASKINIDPDKLKPRDQVLTPDITPERLGLKEFNMRQLWADSKSIIEKIPDLDSRHRSKLKKEAAEVLGIEDVDYEEIAGNNRS